MKIQDRLYWLLKSDESTISDIWLDKGSPLLALWQVSRTQLTGPLASVSVVTGFLEVSSRNLELSTFDELIKYTNEEVASFVGADNYRYVVMEYRRVEVALVLVIRSLLLSSEPSSRSLMPTGNYEIDKWEIFGVVEKCLATSPPDPNPPPPAGPPGIFE
ncbi:24739_t:CDS:2 [Dentiscutata erythropus]|uniref:24739_t:CDS:1 n=1 Tax=Dentiscutata erythropus TaxID=1348616 RepID=A0A9N8WEH6_9GLOM|nr:24739_t:CDS:2 [Dentiscutata erythropus]